MEGGSIGWRMGNGETVRLAFHEWYEMLSDEDAAEFARQNPEPWDWEGWYQRIRTDDWD
jgi:hypothetical protein